MKRSWFALSMSWVVALIMSLGCSGSTTGEFILDADDSGKNDAVVDGSGGSAGSSAVDASSAARDAGGASTMTDGGVASAQVVDGCNALCTKEATAGCPNQGTIANCNVACRLILESPTCASSADALFACEKTSAAACDADGKATLTTCSAQQLSAAACFLQNAADPTLTTPCLAYCGKVSAANCPNDDKAGCPTSCSIAGNLVPGCSAAWKANVTCGATATFVCGSDGKASAAACNLQGASFLVCALNGLAGLADGGQ